MALNIGQESPNKSAGTFRTDLTSFKRPWEFQKIFLIERYANGARCWCGPLGSSGALAAPDDPHSAAPRGPHSRQKN
jgi:hypothetical protein